MSGNDNHTLNSPIVLDTHRGMASQKATESRRQQSDVKADQEQLRAGQAEIEAFLFAGPAATWPQLAEKASYLLRLFAATPDAHDPRLRRMIESALEDIQNLTSAGR